MLCGNECVINQFFLIEKKMSEETQDLQPLKLIQILFVQDLLLIYTGDVIVLLITFAYFVHKFSSLEVDLAQPPLWIFILM